MFLDKLSELKASLRNLNNKLNEAYLEIANGDKVLGMINREVCSVQISLLEKDIKRFERYSRINQGIEHNKKSFDVDLIRGIPIEEILGAPKMSSGNRSKYICPLHNEDTPSFTVYKDKNTWWCFGCNSGTSVIDLYMKLNNVDFKQACQELTKLYL